MENLTNIKYIGVNDHKIDLFEGQYPVPNGMSYNSYAVIDEKIAIFDTVDVSFGNEWFSNMEKALSGKTPDYLIVQHMEPDHSANIVNFLNAYPDAKIVSSDKAFKMMKNFFATAFEDRRIVVGADAHFMSFMFRAFPRFAPRFFSWVIRKSGLNLFKNIYPVSIFKSFSIHIIYGFICLGLFARIRLYNS